MNELAASLCYLALSPIGWRLYSRERPASVRRGNTAMGRGKAKAECARWNMVRSRQQSRVQGSDSLFDATLTIFAAFLGFANSG